MQQSGKQQRQGPLFSLIILFLGIISLLASPAMAGDGRYQPTDEAHSLPIYMTDEELGRIDEIGIGHRSTDPPPQTPRNCAEWEPLEGVLIRYPLGLPYDLISDFADHFTVYCLVSSGSYSSAVSSFTANGVNMANVEFLIINTDSIWTRDYGPWFVFDGNGDRAVVDHIYNRPRPNDDAVNWQLGPIWGIEVYGHDLHHTGGNYMTDGHGISFSTDLVWNENTGLSHSQIDGIMEEYLGIHTYNVVPDVASTGIHHIDCWAKLLNEETIMVKEVPPTHGDYPECEANAAYLATLTNCYGRPYNVVRIYCPTYSGSSVCAYTNSLILEDRVYVPMFGSQYDDDAIATYEAAMPGYTVLGYDGSWYSDDAIHCRGKGIMDDGMLYVDHNPLQEQTYGAGGYNVVALIDDRSETGLVTGEQVVYWRLQGEGAWTTASLTAMAAPDSFETTIPEQPIYSVVEYYISAEDYSGRISTRPWVAPGGYYTFTIEPSSGIPDGAPVMAVTRLAPNPFHPETSLRFDLNRAGSVTLGVYTADGRLVRNLIHRDMPLGEHVISWDGATANGQMAPAGVYFFRLQTEDRMETARGVLIK